MAECFWQWQYTEFLCWFGDKFTSLDFKIISAVIGILVVLLAVKILFRIFGSK